MMNPDKYYLSPITPVAKADQEDGIWPSMVCASLSGFITLVLYRMKEGALEESRDYMGNWEAAQHYYKELSSWLTVSMVLTAIALVWLAFDYVIKRK